MDYFYNRCLHVYNGFADAPGYRTVSTIRAGVLAQVGKEAALRREGLTWKDFVNEGYVIAGSPKTVRERLTRSDEEPQLRPSDDPAADRLDAAGTGAQEYGAVRARSHAAHARTVDRASRTNGRRNPLPESERAMPAPINFTRKPTTNGKTAHAAAAATAAESRSAK